MLIDCPRCEAIVDAKVLSSYDVFRDGDDFATRYSFAKCPQCARPLLAVEDVYGPDYADDPIRLYPARDMHLSSAVPNAIAEAYSEARSCFRAKAYTAAAIMCRKALQGICHFHGIRKRTLQASLLELKKQEVIESRLYEWADALRISGNEAAHDVSVTVSRDDAADIMEFTRALLEYVYTYREKFEAFKARRAKPSTRRSINELLATLDIASPSGDRAATLELTDDDGDNPRIAEEPKQ